MDISEFIFHKPKVFSPEFCNQLIGLFEEKEEKKETYVGAMLGGIDLSIKNTTEIDLFQHPDVVNNETFFDTVNEHLSNHYLENLPFRYYFDANRKLFNNKCMYETCQIQKYKKGVGHYENWHVEIESLATAKRIFSMIVYLNTVQEGGETSFLYTNKSIKPSQGDLVIFPSAFPFIHCGKKPISDDKYIISTWLIYVPE
jgi:hypothetical protein